MIDVFVRGPDEETTQLIQLARDVQTWFRFSREPTSRAVPLTLCARPSDMPFSVSRDNGVAVCTYHSEDIAQYAEMGRDLYLLICAMLGLVQWRALSLNELLLWEDFFVHEEPPGCLYARRGALHEYALAFERPYVCAACLEFFRCLGAESETVALLEVLDSLAHAA